MTAPDVPVCSMCGRPMDAHEASVRFRFPDPVVELLEAGLDEADLGGDPEHDTLIVAQGAGCYLRVLLVATLDDGLAATYGTWLEVTYEDLERTAAVWTTPEYVDLVVSGRLANAVPPWGDALLGVPASAAVLDDANFPYVVSSSDPLLTRVLNEEWPHDFVLRALPL